MKGVRIAVLFCLLLVGCAPSGALLARATVTPELVFIATNTFVPSPTPSPAPALTETPEPSDLCAWAWAEQPLPEVSKTLEAALAEAGMEAVEASASAFGENCVTGPANQVGRFAAMQTDFRLTVPVENLSDPQSLGEWIARILAVIDAIPADPLGGPNPGQVFIRFVDPEKAEINIQFSRQRAREQIEAGKTGRALYDALHVP